MNRPPAAPLVSASVTTAWVIVGNKPFYPLYVWWLVGSGVRTSLWTLPSLPLFLALPFLAGKAPLAARVGLPLAGLADTAFSDVMFGQSSGVESFFAPCAALAAMSFSAAEVRVSRALTVAVFVVFAALRLASPHGVDPWPTADAAKLAALNFYSAASLVAFIGLRFAGAR